MPKGLIPNKQQVAFPCTYMRGGTSKAIFLHGNDLPEPGPERDAVLMRMMGTPDVNEIDGMGGAQLVTSKLAIIDPPSVPNADVDYTFGQAEILSANIDYKANCGNVSSAVAPFAIDCGLIKAVAPETVVRIYNTNTKKILHAHVAIVNGEVAVQGDCKIAGVPNPGSEILLDFRDTLGAATGKCLPTGNIIDTVKLESGKEVEVTVCDSGNITIMVQADVLGMSCTEPKVELDANKSLLAMVSEIRGKIAERVGLCSSWQKVDEESPMIPFVAALAKPASDKEDVKVRLFLLNKCHPALAGTGSVAVATS